MNCLYTYWSKEGENVDCGFGFPQFFFECAGKSIRTAFKNYESVIIYTDSIGKSILETNIPEVKDCKIVTIDYSEYDFDSRYWNFPKMITYSLQEEPFIHIDFDVFLKDDFSKQTNTVYDIYSETIREYGYVKKHLDKFSKDGKMPNKIICSGIIGGNNIEVFKKNFEIAKEVCKPTKKKVHFEDLWAIEEYSFTKLAVDMGLHALEFEQDSYLHFQGKYKYSKYNEEIKKFEI